MEVAMFNVQNIWRPNDDTTTNEIIERKNSRNHELVTLFTGIRKELSNTAEKRSIDGMIERVKELEQEEIADQSRLQSIIEKYENTCCGSTSISSAKGFAWCLKIIGFFGMVISIAQLLLDGFADQDDSVQGTATAVFTIAAAIFTSMLTCGMTVDCLGQRAINKAMKYRKFTWNERRELKMLLKYFDEVRDLRKIEELDAADRKFEKLSDPSLNIPFDFNGTILFEDQAELTNYLLLSLPASHPIRQKLETIELFATNSLLPDSPFPSSSISIEEASHATSEHDIESGLPEPEIEIIPHSVDETVDTDFFCDYCLDKLEEGQTFEKGILKHINAEVLESHRTEVTNLISRKAAICRNWIEIESYAGPSFSELQINRTKVPRSKVFREMPYTDFKRRASIKETPRGMERFKEEVTEEPKSLWHRFKSAF